MTRMSPISATPRGVRIFVEFADLVRRKKEGYLEYVWQWKDDPRRLVPKESYIRGFEPWGWIIGTGIYIDDVNAEIGRIEQNLVRVSGAIAVLVSLLLLYVMRGEPASGARTDGCRGAVARIHIAVSRAGRGRHGGHAAGAGRALSVRQSHVPGHAGLIPEPELELLDPVGPASLQRRERRGVERHGPCGPRRTTRPGEVEGLAAGGRDQTDIACLFTVRRIEFAGRSGFILVARPRPLGPRTTGRPQGLHRPPASASRERRHRPVPGDRAGRRAAGEVVDCCRRTGGLVRSLLDCGAHPRHITRNGLIGVRCGHRAFRRAGRGPNSGLRPRPSAS